MKSLFLRIFVWFWVAMLVVIAILILSSPYWTQVRPAVARWEQRVFARLAADAQRTSDHLLTQGVDHLPEDRRHGGRGGGRGGGIERYVYDHDGVEIFDHEPAEEGLALVRRCLQSGETETERSGFVFMLARPVTGADGEPYALLLVSGRRGGRGERGRPPHPIEILEPRVLLPRLLVMMLIVGGLCYWLSRYLTSPLRRLRAAARGLAGGDLSVRVDPAVVSRRDEIGDLAREVDTMAERIQVLVESQRRLLRDVSHELRSPLARLEVGLALAREDRGDEQVQYLDRIELESARLNQLIGQLTTLTRMEGGIDEVHLEVVDLACMVQEVVADADFEASARDCTVHFEAAPGEIRGDAALVRSAVENVVRNALRYTAPGTAVEVRLEAQDEWAVVVVRDHGPGVPDEHLDQIFRPFARVADDRDRETGGVGLGLAIADRAARLHGGKAWAKNVEGGGLEVALQFAQRIA